MVADKAHTIAEMKAAKAQLEADIKKRLNDFAFKYEVEIGSVDLNLSDLTKYGHSGVRVIDSVKVTANI